MEVIDLLPQRLGINININRLSQFPERRVQESNDLRALIVHLADLQNDIKVVNLANLRLSKSSYPKRSGP